MRAMVREDVKLYPWFTSETTVISRRYHAVRKHNKNARPRLYARSSESPLRKLLSAITLYIETSGGSPALRVSATRLFQNVCDDSNLANRKTAMITTNAGSIKSQPHGCYAIYASATANIYFPLQIEWACEELQPALWRQWTMNLSTTVL